MAYMTIICIILDVDTNLPNVIHLNPIYYRIGREVPDGGAGYLVFSVVIFFFIFVKFNMFAKVLLYII